MVILDFMSNSFEPAQHFLLLFFLNEEPVKNIKKSEFSTNISETIHDRAIVIMEDE